MVMEELPMAALALSMATVVTLTSNGQLKVPEIMLKLETGLQAYASTEEESLPMAHTLDNGVTLTVLICNGRRNPIMAILDLKTWLPDYIWMVMAIQATVQT